VVNLNVLIGVAPQRPLECAMAIYQALYVQGRATLRRELTASLAPAMAAQFHRIYLR
jgi:hypothetical protein